MAATLRAADPPATPAQQPLRKKSGYLPGLDGWRAIAILGVLMVHDTDWRLGHFTNAGFKRFGGFGVELFFAISGFLVCTRILEEEATIGHFRLKAFYLRRFFRIQPASLAYLGVIAVLMMSGAISESWHHWVSALLQYANYTYNAADQTGAGIFTGHFWTLAVEEHFYIVLSLLLFFFRKRRIAIFASVIAAIWVLQVILRRHGLYNLSSLRQTQWNILFLLTPSLLALLLRVQRVRSLTERVFKPWVAYIATAVLMLLGRLQYCPSGHFWVAGEIFQDQAPYLYFGFALWVIATSLHAHSWSTRLLELRAVKFFGRLSYSLYLWHVLFFVLAYDPGGASRPALLLLTERPWKYIASLAMALISYYCIEKPMIRLGHKLAPPVTPGHTDLRAAT